MYFHRKTGCPYDVGVSRALALPAQNVLPISICKKCYVFNSEEYIFVIQIEAFNVF
jgi:hypothetical protein